MRATSAATLRFLISFPAFDRILGIDTPVRILRFDDLRYDEVSEKMVLACPTRRFRGRRHVAKNLAEAARL
jgi:hypothetical protein